MLNSLTHRLDPCRHLVITERLEMCGRNCSISKQVGGDRIRDLDRAFLCPLCPKLSRLPTVASEDVRAGDVEDEAKASSDSDSKLLKKTAITQSIMDVSGHGRRRCDKI